MSKQPPVARLLVTTSKSPPDRERVRKLGLMTLTWETTTAAARDCEVQPDTPQQPGTPPLAVHDGGLRSAGAGSTDKGSLLQQSSTTQRRPAARSLVEFHDRLAGVACACTRARRRVQSSSGVAVGDGRCRCRVRVLCSCDLLRVPFPWGARRGVMGTVRLFGGEFRLPTVVSCRTVRSDQPFDGFSWRVRWACKKNAKRRGDT